VLAASNARVIIDFMMEAARTPETSVNFYQTTQINSLKYGHINTHHRENLIYHISLPVMYCTAASISRPCYRF
jgi:hypothetical protein